MEFLIGLVLGSLVGGIAMFVYKIQTSSISVSDKEFGVLEEKNRAFKEDFIKVKDYSLELESRLKTLSNNNAILETELKYKKSDCVSFEQKINNAEVVIKEKDDLSIMNRTEIAKLVVQKEAISLQVCDVKKKLITSDDTIKNLTNKFNAANEKQASLKAAKEALEEKLHTQKHEVEELRKSFNTEFENIANKILEEKTNKFTSVNKDNIASILKPLGENINSFKKQIEDAYTNETKERFSLIKEIRALEELNGRISRDAQNLTTALKGDSKTQGNWGEMILERILEQSGLRKGEQYRMEVVLKDDDGKDIKSDAGKSMRPDAVIDYPDDRKVIIDSKVSLTAYTRYIESEDFDVHKIELDKHVKSVKAHIDELNVKAYDSYNKSLDFVMMFIPTESAYIAALKHDSELWNYAYAKRIILISPTNLITALKMINDLWKREDQSKNAQAIAERGALLYDKFVGFTEKMLIMQKNIGAANIACDSAISQLSEGRGNLVGQALKLKELGVSGKKEISASLVNVKDCLN